MVYFGCDSIIVNTSDFAQMSPEVLGSFMSLPTLNTPAPTSIPRYTSICLRLLFNSQIRTLPNPNKITMSKSTPQPNSFPTGRSRQKSSTAKLTKPKRELDRMAQRNCRESTKNRIAFLEGKVRNLETRNQNSQYSSLVVMQETLVHAIRKCERR